MASYMAIYRKIWTGDTFNRASDDGKLAAFYLLTNPHGNTEGFYRLPLTFAAYEMKWPVERIRAAFDELDALGFVVFDYDRDLVLIPNALVFNEPKGIKRVKGALNSVSDIPASPLWATFIELAKANCQEFSDALSKTYPDRLEASEIPLRRGIEGVSKGYLNSVDTPSNTPSPSPSPSPPAAKSLTTHTDEPDETTRTVTAAFTALGYHNTTPTAGELRTVALALTRGHTPDAIIGKTTASVAADNPRSYWLKAVTNLANEPPEPPKPDEPLITCPDCRGDRFDYNDNGDLIEIDCQRCNNKRRIPLDQTADY